MTLHVPDERDMHDSACMNSLMLIWPALTSSLNRQTSVPDPSGRPRIVAVQHRAAGDDDRRQIAARRAHDQRRRRLVAAAEQDHAVDRIAANRLLDVHRGEIAEQHRGRPQAGFAERHDRELERHAAAFPHTALDVLGDLAEVPIARGQLRPRVADADDRLAFAKMPSGRPRPTQLRWMNPSLSILPNHDWDRYLRFDSVILWLLPRCVRRAASDGRP